MSERVVNGRVQKRKTIQRNVALYPQDIEAVTRLQSLHKLDSFSQVIRRLIRDAEERIKAA